MSMMYLLIYFSLTVGLIKFSFSRDHFLIMLLSLEFMVIFIFSSMLFWMNMSSVLFSLIYLIFSACEGALGLSILVIMSRINGSEHMKIFSLM